MAQDIPVQPAGPAVANPRTPLYSALYRFMVSLMEDYTVVNYFVKFVYGVITGTALFLGLMHNIPLSSFHYWMVGLVFISLCTVVGMFSTLFRCSALLIFPSMIGSRGQGFLKIVILQALCLGPLANIHYNIQNVALSMGCNIDLQIMHSKLLWRMVTKPYTEVLQEIVRDSVELQKEAQNVSKEFEAIREEVMGQYGYDSLSQNHSATDNSTQEQFRAKTMMRCEHVVKEGMGRCKEWFATKWDECMDFIKYPVISHFLCLPMKFKFLCNIMNVMTPYCKEAIPVEGNFGQTYDKLDSSISKLGEQFTANISLQTLERESVYGITDFSDRFRKELDKSYQEQKDIIAHINLFVRIALCFMFVTAFLSAFSYARQYSQDIRFDNVYITKYFKRIDERRRLQGKRYLLPLKKAEKLTLIDPCSLKIHPRELQLVTASLVQFISLGVFVGVVLAIDGILYHIFNIIRRHTFTEFSYQSGQDIHIEIGGDSMLAKFLRKTIGAFNTTSNMDFTSSNQQCLPEPRALSSEHYMWNILLLFVMGFICCAQVYGFRLRRVIMAFFYRKREKTRTLFLYNLQKQRRRTYVNRLAKQLRTKRMPPKMVLSILLYPLRWLQYRLFWCWVCKERVKPSVLVCCRTAGCKAIYCPQCWTDLQTCYVCSTEMPNYDNDSDADVYYGTGS